MSFELVYNKEKNYFEISMFNKEMIGTRILARIGKKKALLLGVKKTIESDKHGKYELWILDYVSPRRKKKTFTGKIKVYEKFVIFEIINHFEIKGKKNKHLFGNPYISFPSFEGEIWDDDCSCLSFKRQAPFNYPEQWSGRAVDSLRDGKNSPLIITNKSFETVVISSLNHLLYGTVSIGHFPPNIRCGIPRALKLLPKDTSYKTLMYYEVGVNKTLDQWGAFLRRYHKVKPIPINSDVHLKYISYWTNAGSAYWYHSYKNQSYEETLHFLKTHHEKIGLHFGSYQLDSWWYKKDGDNYTSGITEWEPKKITRSKNFNSMLPFVQKYKDLELFKKERISHVQKILDRPIGCHFKQLSNDSVYVKGAEENYIIEEFALPKNKKLAKELFYHLFNHPKWHLSYIVHDWLQFMNDRHSGFNDIKIGPDYFSALDEVCMEIKAPHNDSGHLSIQLCMTQPHMTLNSVSMASVTSIRSTSDSDSFFVEGTKRWWWHLYSSKFIQVLGKYAFYDNRRSNKKHSHPLSSHSVFEMIWLPLSCGPIGIGDKIGEENVELICKVIKEDGEILRPDVPSSPLDQCYLTNPHKSNSNRGVTVFTYSDIQDVEDTMTYRVFYMLTFNAHVYGRKVTMDYCMAEVGAKESEYAVYDYFSGDIKVVSPEYMNVYSMKRRKFYYHIVAPIKNGFAFLGEVTKHVSCSKQIIKSIDINEKYVTIKICYRNRKRPSTFVLYCDKRPSSVTYDDVEQVYSWENSKLSITIEGLDIETDGLRAYVLKIK